MKRQLSNTIYGLKFAVEKNDFERLKSSSGKKRNDFVANPIDISRLEGSNPRAIMEFLIQAWDYK